MVWLVQASQPGDLYAVTKEVHSVFYCQEDTEPPM